MPKKNLDVNLIPYTEINPNPNRVINLNVQHKTIKFLEENMGEYLYDLELGRVFRHDIKSTIYKRNK